MSKDVRPSSIDGIKRTAKDIAKQTGLSHTKALDAAAKLGGFQNFAHAQKAFATGLSFAANVQRGPIGFHEEARADWVATCNTINPTNSNSLAWSDVSAIVAALSQFMGENRNHTHLPSGGGVDFHSVRLSHETRCIEFNTGSGIGYIGKPKSLTFERIAEDEAESFFLLELDNLAPSGVYEVDPEEDRNDPRVARLRQREEVVELSPAHYVDRGVWDAGHLGYDENGYETPLPASSRLISRWMRGKMLFVCKRSRWNLDNSTYDGRHNKLAAQQVRRIIEMSIAEERKGSTGDGAEDRYHVYETTDEAEDALPNGTRVLHIKRDRPGRVTGSQWSHGRLVYNVTWEDKRGFPYFVDADKIRPATQ